MDKQQCASPSDLCLHQILPSNLVNSFLSQGTHTAMDNINELAFRSGQSYNTVHYKACLKCSSTFHLHLLLLLRLHCWLETVLWIFHHIVGGGYRLFIYFRNRNTLTSTDVNKVLKLSFKYQFMSMFCPDYDLLVRRSGEDSYCAGLAVGPLLEFLVLTQYQIGDKNKGSPQAVKKLGETVGVVKWRRGPLWHVSHFHRNRLGRGKN